MNLFVQEEFKPPRLEDKWMVSQWNGGQSYYRFVRMIPCYLFRQDECKAKELGMCSGKRGIIHHGWRDQAICVFRNTSHGETPRLSEYYMRTRKGDKLAKYLRELELAKAGATNEHDRER